jgi:uncharacterized protein YnzC (UPF0291/DUF896 family)
MLLKFSEILSKYSKALSEGNKKESAKLRKNFLNLYRTEVMQALD